MIYFVFFAIHELLSSIKTARAIKIVRGVGGRLRAIQTAREWDCARARLRGGKYCARSRMRAIKNARGKDCARSRLQTSKIARDQECAGEDCARSRLQASKIARGKDCAGERLRAIKTAREKDCARVRLCGIKIARLCWRLEDHVFLIFRVVEKGWPYGAGVMENMTSLV